MKIAIAMPGLADLDRLLGEMGNVVATRIAKDAIRESAELLQDAWSKGAPYDSREKTKSWTLKSGERRSGNYGHLYQNIRVGPVKPQKEHAVVFKVTTGDAFWGHIVEFGKFDQPPRPWARPIIEQMKHACLNVQIETLRAGIDAHLSKNRMKFRPASTAGLSFATVKSLRNQGRIS